MPAMIVPRESTELIETTAVSFRRDRENTMLHSASLQNPTECRRNSPFFRSVLGRFVLDGPAIDSIGDHGVKTDSWSKGRNIVIVDFWRKARFQSGVSGYGKVTRFAVVEWRAPNSQG